MENQKYFGLPFDFKITTIKGSIQFIQTFNIDFKKSEIIKMQQFTGVLDRNDVKIYFGDTLRFADKWEWYRGTWYWKFMRATSEEEIKLREEYDKLPYEERLIENKEDFEWLLSGDIQSYWEVVK